MTSRKAVEFKVLPVAAIGAAAALVFVVLLALGRESSFPALPTGSYVGSVTGLGDVGEANSPRSMYVERTAGGDALLFVVFQDEFRPQIVPITWRRPDSSAEERQTAGFLPPTVTFKTRQFTLHGAESNNQFTGEVLLDGSSVGIWSLRPISPKELRKDAIDSDSPFDVASWLRLKGEYRMAGEAHAELKRSIDEMQERREKLARYVQQGDALKQRAESRRVELEEKLTSVAETQEGRLAELKGYVRELDQLNRITRRGRTIELARRVGKRENKWYLVNWEQGMDLSSLEAGLANRMNVDVRKLDQQVNRARELDRLKTTIIEERARVRKLQKMYRDKIRENTGGQENIPAPTEGEGEQKPWWKKWDSLFG
ncbi:MAG: hypothetical protein KDD69_07030 [Bdellovibrionales bacterium]|nr:hypothetical protein [Bdellovibrionales bacterium]